MAVYKDEKELLSTDWMSKIKEAEASGNMELAAQYEQARNDKIASKNYAGTQTATNNYSQYAAPAAPTAPTVQGIASAYDQQFMTPDEIASIEYFSQLAKTAKQNGDSAAVKSAHDAAEALRAKYGYSGGAYGDQFIKLEDGTTVELPTYDSQYSSQIDSLLSAILNREPFSYDHTTDPTYLAYEDKYKRLGDRAREDVLGDVAGLTGGYASSWATTAASQAQNDYNQQLSDVIPTLYDAAYNRYLNEDALKKSDLGVVMDVDNTNYGRYRDTVEDTKWGAEFDYTKDRDKVADEKWQTEFDWNKTVDEWNMKTTEDTNKFDQMLSKWSLVGVADKEVAEYFGVPEGSTTESYYFNKANLALNQAKLARSGSGSGSGSGGDDKNATHNRNLAIEEARRTILNTGSYTDAAKSIIQNAGVYGLDMDDYFSICKELGVSDNAAKQVYIDYKNEYLASESGGGDKDYMYYAGLMGQQSDPEAWLAQNKYSIPSDILQDLYNLLDY